MLGYLFRGFEFNSGGWTSDGRGGAGGGFVLCAATPDARGLFTFPYTTYNKPCYPPLHLSLFPHKPLLSSKLLLCLIYLLFADLCRLPSMPRGGAVSLCLIVNVCTVIGRCDFLSLVLFVNNIEIVFILHL